MRSEPNTRSSEDVSAAIAALTLFKRAGYELFPLKVRGKTPAHKGWRERSYENFAFPRWLARGGNVGVRLGPADIVLDLDPRNVDPGDEPLARLSADIGTELSNAPTVITGSGGLHHYWTVPEGTRVRGKVLGYPGLDIKALGGFVVAPGSVHPDTSQIYHVDQASPPICLVARAPDPLIDLLRKPDRPERVEGAGVVVPEQLAVLLDVLDPSRYGHGHYDEWVRIAAAAHDATGGSSEAFEVFAEWCARDPLYNDAFESVARAWNSFTAGKAGGVSCRTLFRAVVDAGHADLVVGLGVENLADEFPDDDFEVVDLDGPTLTEDAEIIDPQSDAEYES